MSKISTATPIAPALEVSHPDEVRWRDSADVVVVGWGAAGACAAIEARAAGASVLVLDRFEGGGASAAARGECEDPFGKSPDMGHVMPDGPYYALDISMGSPTFPLATLSLADCVFSGRRAWCAAATV